MTYIFCIHIGKEGTETMVRAVEPFHYSVGTLHATDLFGITKTVISLVRMYFIAVGPALRARSF
jgi:hypothetical protein